MAQSTEQIEAKLAAYVDGELTDPRDIEEIERHLAEHPSHRKMIQELRTTRAMVSALPRERAPADLTDAIQGAMERAALLGDSGDDAPAVIRMNFGAQLRLVAAVLLLAIGLGAVVYALLPNYSGLMQEIATIQPPPAPMAGDRENQPRDRDATDMQPAGKSAAAEPSPPSALPGVHNAKSGDTPIANDQGGASPDLAAMTLVVRSASSDEAKKRVEDYFVANAIRFETQPLDQSKPLETLADEYRNRLVAPQTAAAPGDRTGSGAAEPIVGKDGVPMYRTAPGAPSSAQTTPAQSQPVPQVQRETANQFNPQQSANFPATSNPAELQQRAQQIVDAAMGVQTRGGFGQNPVETGDRVLVARNLTRRQAEELSRNLGSENVAESIQTLESPARRDGPIFDNLAMKQQELDSRTAGVIEPGDLIEIAMDGGSVFPVIQRRIVPQGGTVRLLDSEAIEIAGRSPEEAEKLLAGSRVLRSQDASERINVRVLKRGVAPGSPETQFRIGESIAVTVPGLKAPGMDEHNIVRVREDGTVTLPMLDPVSVLGFTDESLEREIAKRYSDAGLIQDAKVSVSRTERFDPMKDERIDLLVVVKGADRSAMESGATTTPATMPDAGSTGAATEDARSRQSGERVPAPTTRPSLPPEPPATRPN